MIAGRYRLEQRIAAGGMGEVWRGTDTRLNRVVAIKLLHAGLSGNDRFRARFHQEAQAVAQLQSPGIVGLYDYGEEHAAEGLVSYLIMELARGKALDNVLRERRRLSPNETLKIMASAAEALDVAHQAHIIHRDIKPGNLLVDTDGSVKIVDFGIAASKASAGLTETGTVMGTLAYASPEQLQGSQLTGATDVYSLGIVGYEALAGRPPFAGNEPTAAITGHLTMPPPPLPPDVPGPVAQIIMRCLAKDPRQRFASAAELARVCRAGGMGAGTTAIISSPPPSQSPQTRVMGAAGAAAAGMAAGSVAAHTSVQPVQHDEYGSPVTGQYGAGAGTGQYRTGGANERSLPPPRDAEEPKRSPTGPILVTVAGLAVVLIAILLWSPWNDDEDGRNTAADATTGESVAETSEEAAATEEETTEEDSGGEDNNEGGGQDDEEQESEETTEEEVISIPDVTGDSVFDAIEELEGEGFTDVSTETANAEGEEVPEDAEACTVESQTPQGDTGAPYYADEPITLSYWDDGGGCGL
ncbi:serine/threonine-protein kinase [Glycomyces harbinensis]|uniref:non-specific serine/threonine protein kinase n=1 Tax=Glycomyces harbinensis TaxID=58114 RepID=A0A1G6RJR2_9ACTN|nr:serine/threonine-protein kinase [Glycomyces harbinensis]SDD04890.1 serine/threonine protein kinase [Glycomyces harbinensis]